LFKLPKRKEQLGNQSLGLTVLLDALIDATNPRIPISFSSASTPQPKTKEYMSATVLIDDIEVTFPLSSDEVNHYAASAIKMRNLVWNNLSTAQRNQHGIEDDYKNFDLYDVDQFLHYTLCLL